MERVEGGDSDYGGPSQDGSGPRCGRYGEVASLMVTTYIPVGRLHSFTSTLYKGSVNCSSTVIMLRSPTHGTVATRTVYLCEDCMLD